MYIFFCRWNIFISWALHPWGRKEPCKTLLQSIHCSLHYSHEFIERHYFYMILSSFCLKKKTLHFLQKVTPRHIFSCWESLECHRSYSPAGLTCFVGNETVGLAGTPGQHNPIRKQRHLSICPLCFPTYPSSTILSSPFTGFQAVCFTSSAKPGSCQACYGCGRAYYLPAATIVVVGFVELAGLALQI